MNPRLSSWMDLLKRNNIERYLVDVANVFAEPMDNEAVSEAIAAFYAMEMTFFPHQNPKYQMAYVDLFGIIRDHLFVPMVFKNQYNLNCLAFVELIARSGVTLTSSPQSETLFSEIQNIYTSSTDYFKAILANMELILTYFTGKDRHQARTEYLTRIVDLDFTVESGIRSVPALLKNVLDVLFSNLEELIAHLIQHIFPPEFLDKPLKVQKSNIIWTLFSLWKSYGAKPAWLEIYSCLLGLFRQAVEKGQTELAFYLHFPVSHIYGSLTQTQAQWAALTMDLDQPLGRYIADHLVAGHNLRPPDTDAFVGRNRWKVGFVCDLVVNNPQFNLLYHLLEGLVAQGLPEYEYYVYDLEYIEKSISDKECINKIRDLGVSYVNIHDLIDDRETGLYYSHFNKCLKLREKMTNDEIDIFISSSRSEQDTFLFATRTSSLQIYWAETDLVYDVAGIDYRITHRLGTRGTLSGHEYYFFHPPIMVIPDSSKSDPKLVAELRQNYPENAFLLGSIDQLPEIADEKYLQAVAEILHDHPQAIYLACGIGGSDDIDTSLKQKIAELGIEDRFYFPGASPTPLYAHVIDLYLHPFSPSTSTAPSEYLAQGGALLALQPFDLYDQTQLPEAATRWEWGAASFLFHDGQPTLSFAHVATGEEYVLAAGRLISDAELRTSLGSMGKWVVEQIFCPKASARSFSALIGELLKRKIHEIAGPASTDPVAEA
ncbi:MAG: glycosyltransferase [Deltaproteobacteria bacterium]|nr:glycosyltransferase [Deltaproteobacteria bacterium]